VKKTGGRDMNDLDLCGMNYIEVYDRHKEEVMVDRMVHEARKELEIYYDDDDRPSVWDDDDLYYDPSKKYND
jgi:hypothetical protein